MTKDEALKLALEALEDACGNRCNAEYNPCFQRESITAIKEALAQTEQEPVACVTYKEVADTMNGLWGGTIVQRQIAEELEKTMLYTTPPQRTWVGLTDEEVLSIVHSIDPSHQYLPSALKQLARAIEAKLKEKNT